MSKFYAFYPPSGGASSNASVGPNGDPSPASSTLIGGVSDVNGTLVPAHMNADGALDVSDVYVRDELSIIQGQLPPAIGPQIPNSSLSVVTATGFTVPVSASSLPLPAGAATSALQTSGNASLTSINAKQPPLGQAVAASSTPVVLASDQTLPLPTGAATETTLAALGAKIPSQGQKVAASSLPVVLASDQTLPLPAGAATETTLAALNTKTPALGQAVMASSQPVVIASNQSAIPVSTVTSDSTATGSITIINSVPAGTATAGSAVVSSTLNGAGTGTVQVTGTYTGALSLQYTVDGTNWVTAGGTPFLNIATGVYSATIASATVGIFQFETTAMQNCRITALAAVTGTAVVTMRISRAANMVTIDNPLPPGTNVIGALSANQSTNVAQINGVAPLMGNGVTGTGSLRVTLASDTTSNTNPLLTAQKGRAQANAPVYNAYGTTPVTTSAYVQLVASTTAATTFVDIFDSSGQAMILATGAAASEVILAYIPPGGLSTSVAIPAGTRVSVKALTANATTGYLLVNFWG